MGWGGARCINEMRGCGRGSFSVQLQEVEEVRKDGRRDLCCPSCLRGEAMFGTNLHMFCAY